MKKLILTSIAVATIATSAQAYRGNGGYYNSYNNTQSTSATLTQEQKDALVFMYQEEKLARDVYLTLNDKWGARVFENISSSEQKHMDAVKSLLNKYNIEVPVLDDTIGVFENEELQALYDELVEKGLTSLNDAYEVGVTIEETDIADLEERIENATSDIQRVFSNLLRGSNNHLSAFNRQLDSSLDNTSNDSYNQNNSSYKSQRGNKKGGHRGFGHKGERWGR